MPLARTPPHLTTLILLTAFSTLTLNMFLPSLASIAADLEADYALVSLSVGLYLAVTGVIQLIVGPLSDRYGRRPVLLVAILIFAAASVICALAEDIWTFLIFRMAQGGMIAGYAVSLAIVRDTTSEKEATGLISYITMAMAVAPMAGPMLGGVLDTVFGWRANFWFYAASGAALLVLCWLDLGETNDAQDRSGRQTGREAKELLSNAAFWAYSACAMFSVGAFYIFLAGAPLVAATVFGVSTATLGVYIGSITAGFMTGGFLSARLSTRLSPITLVIIGRCVACAGLSGGLALVLAGVLNPLLFFGSTIFVGLGNGLTMPGTSAGALSVRPSLAGTAAGVNGALIVAGGAVFTTLTGALLSGDGMAAKLLTMMLAASAAGLVCAIWAWRLRGADS